MTIRWGLLGCGDIAAKRVADAIRLDERSELVAACRRDEDRLSEFADRHQIARRTTSDVDLVGGDDIDAVYVATPVHLHCGQTVAAAESGKHVLVEKPMALDVDQCRRMIDACDAAGVTLGVAYYRRFYPVVRRIAQWIADGSVGRPVSILATTGNPIRFPADDWRVIRSLGGGGPLMDIGSHRLDLFLDLFGPVATTIAACHAGEDFEAEDMATVVVEFRRGGHGVLQCYFGTVDVPDRLEVIGTGGRITVDDLNSGEAVIVTGESTRREAHPPHENVHAPLIADFTAAIAEDRSPAVPGRAGMETNRIIEQAYRMAR